MKNFFDFSLTGKKLLPIWLMYLVFLIIPYAILILKTRAVQQQKSPSLLFLPLLLIIIFAALVLTFYMAKLVIENVIYKEKSIVFTGTFSKYIGMVLIGFFLSIITLGIYISWFVCDMQKFFIDNSTYNSQPFKFRGTGGKLFVIILLTLFVPIMILTIIMTMFLFKNNGQIGSFVIIQQVVTIILMVPYMYFTYKWMVNIDFKSFKISWETNVWNSLGTILLELVLSIVTLGIYSPLAMLRLYKYFSERTTAVSPELKQRFGYDIDQLNDFLFIWGQTLLTIVTLGIYYPWAFCNIGKKVLNKTYLLEESV